MEPLRTAVGAGLSYAATDHLSLVGGYRYFAAAEIEINDVAGSSISGEYDSHSIEFGLPIRF